jgi:hypothetical protein
VKPLGVMINVLGTLCYDTKLVCMLINQLKFKIILEQVKQGAYKLHSTTQTLHLLRVLTIF